ncbi:MAG: hypothetical protein ACI85O_002845 [Saprospiraceae bacterium]|jgi:hypothetical protein
MKRQKKNTVNDSKRLKRYKEVRKFIYVLTFAFFPFCWFVYDLGPNIVFYFDNVKGTATITNITRGKVVEFHYYHEYLDRKVKLVSNGYKKESIEKIASQKSVDINYSINFPEMVELKGLGRRPDFFMSLFLILIWTVPLFIYKDIDF